MGKFIHIKDIFKSNENKVSCKACFEKTFEPRHEKTNVLVFDLVRHKPGCTATEDG